MRSGVYKFISLRVIDFVSLSPIGRRKKCFRFAKGKKMNTRKSNQELINSKEYQLKNPPTQNLKLLFFLLQNHSNFRSVLAKISVKKQVKSRFFYPFTTWGLSFLSLEPAFCTILPFYFACQLIIFYAQLPAFSTQNPTFSWLICPSEPCA